MTPGPPADRPANATLFDLVGGRPFFDALAERFYAAVEHDAVLRPLYPEDLTEPKRHTAGFLAQYWGGGEAHYSAERGHPRLRMRHMPFAIGVVERDAWLLHMLEALRAADLPPDLEARMADHFTMAANHLVNS